MQLRTLAALMAIPGIAVVASRAHAQSDDAKKKAKDHYEKGTTHYNLGRFDEAIKEFEAAYELYPEPVFLYNIAQAHRMKGNWERARFFYKRFLSLAPNSPNKADVEARIAEMDDELKKQGGGTGGPGTGGTGTGGTGTGGTGTGGTGTGGTGTGGTGTSGTKTGGTGIGTGATGTLGTGGSGTGTGGTGGTSVAGNGGSGSGSGGSSVAVDDGGIGTAVTPPRPRISLEAVAGPAFVRLGGGFTNVPVQFAVQAGGTYLFTRGTLALGAGGGFSFTPIPYVNVDDDSSQNAGLLGLVGGGEARYAVAKAFDVRANLGLGVTWFTGLKQGNPFTQNNVASDGGPVPMFTVRFGLAVDYAITKSLKATVVPISFAYSPPPAGVVDTIVKVQQIDVLFGLGYSL
jgi:hypothetical protein